MGRKVGKAASCRGLQIAAGLLLVIAVSVLSGGCAKRLSGTYVHTPQNPWGGPTIEQSLEFKKDGTLIANDGIIAVVGSYEIDGDEITLYVEALGTRTAHKAALRGDTIRMVELTGSMGDEVDYVKVR